MDPAQRERRIGILVVILVLLAVVLFWMLHLCHAWPRALALPTQHSPVKELRYSLTFRSLRGEMKIEAA